MLIVQIGVTVLSGSTWKGTKLRIGDAKQDFRERYRPHRTIYFQDDLLSFTFRLQQEQETELDPSKKKRKRLRGTFAEDMSLVDPSNASSRSGWKVTAMGRIVRPIKMRPEKPLPPQLHSAQTANRKDGKERKKRAKDPDYRARRRMIDPTKWDSVHLKGMWLDVITAPKEREPMDSSVAGEEDSEDISMDGPAHASGGNPVQIKKLRDLFAPREEEGSHFFFNIFTIVLIHSLLLLRWIFAPWSPRARS